MVLLVVQLHLAVRGARGQLPGDLAGHHLGLEVGLADQVGPQDEEDGEAGPDEGDGDDQGGPEGGRGPDGPHRASSR